MENDVRRQNISENQIFWYSNENWNDKIAKCISKRFLFNVPKLLLFFLTVFKFCEVRVPVSITTWIQFFPIFKIDSVFFGYHSTRFRNLYKISKWVVANSVWRMYNFNLENKIIKTIFHNCHSYIALKFGNAMIDSYKWMNFNSYFSLVLFNFLPRKKEFKPKVSTTLCKSIKKCRFCYGFSSYILSFP